MNILKTLYDLNLENLRPNLSSIFYSKVTIGANLYKEGSMAERFKAPSRNPVGPGSSPLPAGHAGVNSVLADLPASWGF